MTGILSAVGITAIILLLVGADALQAALRHQRTEIAQLEADNHDLQYRIERLHFEVATLNAANEAANAQIAGMEELPAVTCPCSEMLTARARISYLHARNEKLTCDALANNTGQYIRLNKN